MKTGARDTDAYFAEWRKTAPLTVDGDPEEIADTDHARIVSGYGAARVGALIDNGGWA